MADVWRWYLTNGGSLSSPSSWFKETGSPTGPNVGTPLTVDSIRLRNNGVAGQVLTGSLQVEYLEMLGGSNTTTRADFVLGPSAGLTTGRMLLGGTLTVRGTLVQNDAAQFVQLYGGTLTVDGGAMTAYGIGQGVSSGGTFQALNNARITLLGAPNSVASSGLFGLSIKQTGLIDHSTVDSSTGLISVGAVNPVNSSTLTVQNGSSVKALYTFLSSAASNAGSLVISGVGTTYADVGPSSASNGSGGMFVGGVGSGDAPLTANGMTATLTVSSGASLTESQNASIGDDQFSVGAATVSTGGTWTVGRFLRVGRSGTGSLTVNAGSTVRSVGPHVNGNASISFGTNAGGSGSGLITGAGALLDAGGDRITVGSSGNGTLVVSGGGTVRSGAGSYTDTETAFAIGAGAGTTGAVGVTGAGSLLQAAGVIAVGGNNSGAGYRAGGTGSLSVASNGKALGTGLALFSGGTVGLDGTGIIELGGTGGTAGAVTVEAGSAGIVSYGGLINGSVVNNGAIANYAGTLTISGTVAGSGTMQVNGAVTIGALTGGQAITFGAPGARLNLYGESGGTALVNFGAGAVLDFVGQAGLTTALAGNTLTVRSAGGAVLAQYGLYGQPAGVHYATAADGAGGTKVTALASAGTDFNADGTSDILLQGGGTVVDWTMNGGLYQSGTVITTGATGFSVVGKGDFNRDGTADVVLQNGSTVVSWIMKNGAYQSGNVLTDVLPAGYSVVGTGDFNGDGTADILLQNGGTVVAWFMANNQVVSASTVTTGAGSYAVVGTGDFDADGTTDILLQSGDTVVDWLVRNGAVVGSNVLTTGAAGFQVRGTGDFNGDGTADIVLQNGGTVVDWIMGNGQYQSGNVLTTGAAGFTVRATGDYNNDGTMDIALQGGGTVVDWIMGNGVYASGNVITTGATGFTVV